MAWLVLTGEVNSGQGAADVSRQTGPDREESEPAKGVQRSTSSSDDSNMARSREPRMTTSRSSTTTTRSRPWELMSKSKDQIQQSMKQIDDSAKELRSKIRDVSAGKGPTTRSWKLHRPTNHRTDTPSTVEACQATLPGLNENGDTSRHHVRIDDYGYMIPHPGTVKDPRISPKTVPVKAHEAPQSTAMSTTSEPACCPRALSQPLTISKPMFIEIKPTPREENTRCPSSTDETIPKIKLADGNDEEEEEKEDDWELVENNASSPAEVATVKHCFKPLVNPKSVNVSTIFEV